MTDAATYSTRARPGADLFTYARQDGPPAPTAAERRFADWYSTDAASFEAEGRYLAAEARGFGERDAGSNVRDAHAETTAALQRLIDAPVTSAADALAVLAALAVEIDLFGEAAEQLGIDVDGLPERLAPFVPAFPQRFGTHE